MWNSFSMKSGTWLLLQHKHSFSCYMKFNIMLYIICFPIDQEDIKDINKPKKVQIRLE